MSKENISATVDPEVAEYLSKDTVNASGVVNRAVKREMGILEESDNDLLKLRLEQVRGERSDLEERAKRKAELEERLEQRVEQNETEERTVREETIERCVEKWSYIPDNTDDPGVKNQAEKANMEPVEFLSAVREAWGEDDA